MYIPHYDVTMSMTDSGEVQEFGGAQGESR